MTGPLIRWGLVSGLFMLAAGVLPTIKVKGWGAAIGAALVLGILNVLLGYPLKLVANIVLFLPNLLSFGLVGLIISLAANVFVLHLVDREIGEDLEIEGIPTLVGLSLSISVLMGMV